MQPVNIQRTECAVSMSGLSYLDNIVYLQCLIMIEVLPLVITKHNRSLSAQVSASPGQHLPRALNPRKPAFWHHKSPSKNVRYFGNDSYWLLSQSNIACVEMACVNSCPVSLWTMWVSWLQVCSSYSTYTVLSRLPSLALLSIRPYP